MPNPEEVIKDFEPEHITKQLPKSTKEMKEEIAENMDTKPKEKHPKDDPRSQKEYTFQFRYESPNGKVWTGQFTNKILSIAEQQAVGVARAKFGGGMPYESLDPLSREINMITAHMSFSLIKWPDWAEDLRAILEIPLLQALYTEVASHEATFLGFTKPQEDSKG